MDKQPNRQEFSVVIDGIMLQPEIAERINRAIQKAVLHEMANIDTRGDLNVRLAAAGNGGSTDGIWVRFQEFGD